MFQNKYHKVMITLTTQTIVYIIEHKLINSRTECKAMPSFSLGHRNGTIYHFRLGMLRMEKQNIQYTYLDPAKLVPVSVFDHETQANNARGLEILTSNSTAEIEQYFDEWQIGFGSCLRPPQQNLNNS